MRKRWLFIALTFVCVGLWCWPYVGAYALARAAERKDGEAVAARVDFPALRRSLAKQMIRSYLRQSGRGEKLGALGRGMTMAVGASMVDPYLAEMLTPDAVTTLLGDGRLKPVTVAGRVINFERALPRLPTAFDGRALSVVAGSHYDGLTSFVFRIPAGAADEDAYGVHLQLAGATWRLAGIDLPAAVLDRIAADIIAGEKKAGQAS